MSTPDKSIDPRLVAAAKEEFLNKGYEKASLTSICKAAGVTTGALYKRYTGKEDLFSALVSDTVRDLEAYVDDIAQADLTKLTDQELYDSFFLSPEGNREWLAFLYERRESFTLLIRCAAGTRYENFHQDWTEKMNAIDYRSYREARRRGMAAADLSLEELHVLTYSVWALFYEPFFYDFTWEQMERHAETIYRFLDWHSALGISKRSE